MTEPTEMELRVAKAISGFGLGEDRIAVARAAIRAMREPTADMIGPGKGALLYEGAAEIKQSWRSMIDAASPERE